MTRIDFLTPAWYAHRRRRCFTIITLKSCSSESLRIDSSEKVDKHHLVRLSAPPWMELGPPADELRIVSTPFLRIRTPFLVVYIPVPGLFIIKNRLGHYHSHFLQKILQFK